MGKVINYNHVMPTRYSVDISFDKANLNKELLKDPMKKKKAKHGQDQVRGEIQIRQEQMVLPEAQVLACLFLNLMNNLKSSSLIFQKDFLVIIHHDQGY